MFYDIHTRQLCGNSPDTGLTAIVINPVVTMLML